MPMVVSELIAALKALPQDLPVVIMDADGESCFDIDVIDQGVAMVDIDGDVEEQDAVRLFP